MKITIRQMLILLILYLTMIYNTQNGLRSALDNYDQFTGWDHQDSQPQHNFLQQLRNNLNRYESNYTRNPSRDIIIQKASKKKKHASLEKENELKLPPIQCLKVQELQRRGSFLILKNRNILKEGIQNIKLSTKPQIIHKTSEQHKLRQIIQKSKENQLDKKPISKSEELIVKKQKESRPLVEKVEKIPKTTITEDQYQFSDQKIIAIHNKQRKNQLQMRKHHILQMVRE